MIPTDQMELPLKIEKQQLPPETGPMAPESLPPVIKELALDIADMIEAIGPPGDYGYSSKRGRVLHAWLDISDQCWQVVSAWDKEHRLPRLARVQAWAESVDPRLKALQDLTWPRDVQRRLPRFYSATYRIENGLKKIREAVA